MSARRRVAQWTIAALLGSASFVARTCDAQASVIEPQAARPTIQADPLSAPLPKACWPASALHGRDTVYAMLPCNSLDVLPLGFRVAVECTMDRLKKGGWDPIVFETVRSDRRQQFLYSYGRTRPGPKVTNAANASTGVHAYYLAVDIIHRTRHWNHPRFFYWVGQHAEACGLVAGAFWKKFPDFPHVQFGAWAGAPPQWARALIAQDSVAVVWKRVGAT